MRQRMAAVAISILLTSSSIAVHGFTTTSTKLTTPTTSTTTTTSTTSTTLKSRAPTHLFEGPDDYNNENDNENENKENQAGSEQAWDDKVDYDKEWPSSGGDDDDDKSIPDPGTSWDTLPTSLNSDFLGSDATELLGIDLTLEPLSEGEADRLRDDARKIVEDAIDAGVNDIGALRKKMKRELAASRQALSMASDLEAKRQSDLLMSKIDGLTGNFLKTTESTRKSTKMAAAASRAMEGTMGNKAKGLEVGTWGVLGGRTVIADDDRAKSGGNGGLLGSMGNAIRESDRASSTVVEYNDFDNNNEDTTISQEEIAAAVGEIQENRILIVADTQKDKLAKQLVPALLKAFEREEEKNNIPNLKIEVLAPTTANMPLGGNDADCVIVFCAGLTQPDALKKMLDRLLRKTLATGGGKVGTPPTQLIGISTLGTERADSFPYSVQNFLGGKLETRRQIEEVLINTVRKRATEPPLDYTIIKMKEGDLAANDGGSSSSNSGESNFSLLPGDVLDDATSIETATQVILQAIAYQPSARNSTMSVSGSLPSSVLVESPAEFEKQEDFWQETFTCLDGPEIWRTTVFDSELDSSSGELLSEEIADYYDRLIEYVREWADLLALSGKGLTTPIRADTNGLDPSAMITPATSRNMLYQDGVRLLFLPTKTGLNYVSREEETRREQKRKDSSSNKVTKAPQRIKKEGGIDVVVEIVNTAIDGVERQQLRVRARRTNYAENAVIKELSETTIVKRLEDALDVFKKDQKA